MVVADDEDADDVQLFFEENVEGKLLQVGSAKARGVEVVPLGMGRNVVDSGIELGPEALFELWRDAPILCCDDPCVFRRDRVKDEVH